MGVAKGQVIWLLLDELFLRNYSEMAAMSENPATSFTPPPLRRRAAIIKHGTFYRRKILGSSASRQAPPQQGTIAVAFYPLVPGPHRDQRITTLLGLAEKEEFVSLVTLAACGYLVESTEYNALPVSLQAIVEGYGRQEGGASWKERYEALTLLCWLASLHCSSSDKQRGAMVIGAVSQLFVSLLYASFIRGNRQLSHKCARLITVLQR